MTSVEVFALLVKSARDSKLVADKPLKGMFRRRVKFVRTNHSARPSVNSLFNKSYRADRSAKKAAIDLLNEMIKNVLRY